MPARAFRLVLLFALLSAAEWWVKLELLAPILWPPTYTATAMIELRRPSCPSFPIRSSGRPSAPASRCGNK
jgi:hypothetical protein